MKPEKKGKNVKVAKKKGNSTLIIGVVVLILLAGVAYAFLNSGSTTKKPDSEIRLPSYAYANPITLKAYKYAAERPDLLEQIPCYCGCGGHSGHRFLRDCYIHDDWTYDDHASYCDVCIGEAIKLQEYLASGKTLKEARALIDEEYSKKGGDRTNTPQVRDDYKPILTLKFSAPAPTPNKVDLSGYSLSEGFRSIADGLKLTPAGANRAYFINAGMLAGTELESQYVRGYIQPDAFYGKKIIAMFSADFNIGSWLELQDLGYDNKNDASLRAHAEQGMKNIVSTRPMIYGHSENVDSVMKLMSNPDFMPTSYSTYEPMLEAVDYKSAGFALVIQQSNSFSDMNYLSLTPVDGKVELVRAYNIIDSKSIPASFNKYNPQMKGNILVIKMTGDFTSVDKENGIIDAEAK